jgi:IclR family transcriptional regulator, acetate operon repressor
MSGALEKSLAILEYLVSRPDGVALAKIAADLDQLRSGCHWTLQALIRHGYVRQASPGVYVLTTRLASLGLSFLSKSGVVDLAAPLLERLAESSEELVRLALVDNDRLTLVAKAQGARAGLRYDPDMGIELRLSCSAAGHAWLMTLSEDEAMTAVTRQGFGDPVHFGPNAPTTMKALLKMLQEHRKRGFSLICDVYAPGMSAMAAPVRRDGDATTAVLVVAGPSVRLSAARMLQLGPELLAACAELASAGQASPLLTAGHLGTWGNRQG